MPASSSAPGMPDGSLTPQQMPAPPPPPRKPALFSALGNMGTVFKVATKSGVLWLFLMLLAIELVLTVAASIALPLFGTSLAFMIASGMDPGSIALPIIVLGLLALAWIICFNTQISLLAPLRQALLDPDGEPRGLKWAARETLGATPRVWLFGLFFGAIYYIPCGFLFYHQPMLGTGLSILGGLGAIPFITLPWFIVARIGLIATVKRSFAILFKYGLAIFGYVAVSAILALMLGCFNGVLMIIPLLGDLLAHIAWLFFGLSSWWVYASLMGLIEADFSSRLNS